MTASGSMHAITETERWLKLTARKGVDPPRWGRWRAAQAVAVPRHVVETAATVTAAAAHPCSRAGIEDVRVVIVCICPHVRSGR